MAAKRRSILPSKDGSTPVEWLWTDPDFEKLYPALYEFTACGLVDGKPRKGGSISLFASQGRLKVCFLDKETQNTFYAVLALKEGLLVELEGILACEHEPWQPVKAFGGKPVY